MTKVYLVMYWSDSDCERILRFYSSKAAAQSYAAKIQKDCDPDHEECWVAVETVYGEGE